MSKRIVSVTLVLVAAFLCATFFMGCTSTSGKKIDRSLLPKVVKGKSTEADVKELFGWPNMTIHEKNGEKTLKYVRTESTGCPCFSIWGVKLTKEKHDAVIFRINTDGIVRDIETTDKEGTGLKGNKSDVNIMDDKK